MKLDLSALGRVISRSYQTITLLGALLACVGVVAQLCNWYFTVCTSREGEGECVWGRRVVTPVGRP